MLARLFEPLSMKIAAGIGLALSVMVAVLLFSNARLDSKLDGTRTALANERATHAVTRNSVDTLQASLSKFIGDGKARQVAQLAAIEQQAERSAALRNRADQIRIMIDEFEPSDPCDCSTPDFVMEGN